MDVDLDGSVWSVDITSKVDNSWPSDPAPEGDVYFTEKTRTLTVSILVVFFGNYVSA